MTVRQRLVRIDMAEPPSEEELECSGEVEEGRAGLESGIPPGMLKAACEWKEVLELLLELAKDVWRERKVPSDWCDAVLVPIPKKGDLSRCDNWRGIACLMW